MNDRAFDDETLMAFADGELEGAVHEQVARAEAGDPAVAARIAMFRRTRELAREALSPAPGAAVPEALSERVGAMVAERGEAPATGRGAANDNGRRWAWPAAASIALLVVGGVGGFLAGNRMADSVAAPTVVHLEAAGLDRALNTVTAGGAEQLGSGGENFRAIATFRDARQTLCREFALDSDAGESIVAVACRSDDAWQVRFSVVAGGAGSGYTPAASLEVLDAYLTASGAGAPLSPEDEAAALGAIDG